MPTRTDGSGVTSSFASSVTGGPIGGSTSGSACGFSIESGAAQTSVKVLLIESLHELAANYQESLAGVESIRVTHHLTLNEAIAEPTSAADIVLLSVPNGITLAVAVAVRRRWPVSRLLLLSFREERLWSPAVDALKVDDCLLASLPEDTLQQRVAQIMQRATVSDPKLFSPTFDGRLAVYQPAGRATWLGKAVPLSLSSFALLEVLLTNPVSCRLQELQLALGWSSGRLALVGAIKRLQHEFTTVDPGFNAIRLLPGIGYRWNTETPTTDDTGRHTDSKHKLGVRV